MKVIRRLKYRFSNVYRIKIGVGLSAIRSEKEYRAVLAFCRNELASEVTMRLNPERSKVYKFTLLLADDYDANQGFTLRKFKGHNDKIALSYSNPYEFIEAQADWYWN